MKLEPVKYKYRTSLRWTKEHKGILSSPGKIDFEVACPPEFGGHEGYWSPEDLFVASLEVCIMTTFLWYIEKIGVKITKYESNAEGTCQMVNRKFIFSEVVVNVKVGVEKEEDGEKIEDAFLKIKKWCVVSKSVKSSVIIKYKIMHGDKIVICK